MMEKDIKLLKSRSRFHLLNTVMLIVALIGIPMNVYFLISSIKFGFSEGIPFFTACLLVIAFATVLTRRYKKKYNFEKSPLEPYEIAMEPTDFETFKSKLGIFPDEPVYNDIYCTLIQRKKDIVLIAEYISDPDDARIEKHYLKGEQNHAVEIAIEEGILSKTGTQHQVHKTGILIMYVFERINDEVLDLLRENVDRDSTLTAAVDLKSGKIFVRALWGGTWHDDVTYKYMLKMLASAVISG